MARPALGAAAALLVLAASFRTTSAFAQPAPAPVEPPVEPPVAAPVAPPVEPPVAPPVAPPAKPPVAAPVAAPVKLMVVAPKRAPFIVDPVADGGTIVLGVAFGTLSSYVLDTGEVRPQQISPTFETNQLLKIDRGAISQRVDPNANAFSNVGLGAIGAYALLDTVLDGVREGTAKASLADAVMYIEALTVTQGVTNMAKIAYRRPRPHAYIARDEYVRGGGDPATFEISETNSALSFFSGHASQAGALSAVATYIAFIRSPGTAKPWLTLAGGVMLTSFVGYERVRSGAHFPTDVLAGAIVGSAIGGLIVHLHRSDPIRERTVWFGAAPHGDGGIVSASGIF